MSVAYLAGFHKPEPHHLPVAVVAPQAQAEAVIRQLQPTLGDRVDLSVLPSVDAARTALRNLQISGAFVPSNTRSELLVAPAASDTTSSVVQHVFQVVADRTQIPMHVTDVVPLNPNDPGGQNAFFFLVVLSVSSYAMSIAIGAAGTTWPWRGRLLLGLGAAAFITTVEIILANSAFHMFGGHVTAAYFLSLLYSLTIMLVGIGLHPILNRFSTMVFASAFVGLNFTSSGGVFESMMQPRFFDWLHQFWIGAGYIEAMRRIVYFPQLSLNQPLNLLAAWFVFSLLCILAGVLVERSRTERAHKARFRPLERDLLSREAMLEIEEDVVV